MRNKKKVKHICRCISSERKSMKYWLEWTGKKDDTYYFFYNRVKILRSELKLALIY